MRDRRFRLTALLAVAAVLATAGTVVAGTKGAIRGNAQANTLRGTPGPDSIYGLGGNDKLYGGAGNDKLYGGPGNDLLVGGPGADVLSCGPGNDTAVGDASDKAAKDCEHVRGIPTGGGTAHPPPPPAPACSNGKDDDGDGKVDYPADPGCDSPTDTDETDPAPPPPSVQAGTYCGFTGQGPGICVTTDGQAVTKLLTSAIVDCNDGSRWTWTVSFSGSGLPIQSDLSFAYSYSGPLTTSPGSSVTNVQESEFVKGTFTNSGTAQGAVAITSISYDYQGQHYSCTQSPVTWQATKQ